MRGRANIRAGEVPSAPTSPASPDMGFQMKPTCPTSLVPEGSESQNDNSTRLPGSGGAAQAAKHILGPKAKERVCQQNLVLTEMIMS